MFCGSQFGGTQSITVENTWQQEQLSPWHREADHMHPRAQEVFTFLLLIKIMGWRDPCSVQFILYEKLSNSHAKVCPVKVLGMFFCFKLFFWHLYIAWHTYGGQETTGKGQFSLSTTWSL